MTIFYIRRKTWCKYPFQEKIDEDFVYFYKSRKKSKEISFLKCDPSLSMKKRIELVKKTLKVKKVILERR